MSELYVSPGAAAKLLGVSTQCLVLWVDGGRLSQPVLTSGGHRRYHRGEVLRLVETQRWQALAERRGSELAAMANDVELLTSAAASLARRIDRLLRQPVEDPT